VRGGCVVVVAAAVVLGAAVVGAPEVLAVPPSLVAGPLDSEQEAISSAVRASAAARLIR